MPHEDRTLEGTIFMLCLIAMAFIAIVSACRAQPMEVKHTQTIYYQTEERSAISDDDHTWTSTVLSVNSHRGALLRFSDGYLTAIPQGNVIVNLTAQVTGTSQPNRWYNAWPVNAAWSTSWNFLDFDFAGDSEINAATYADLVSEGTIGSSSELVTWNGTHWEWDATSVMESGNNQGWLLTPSGVVLPNTFGSPRLRIEYGLPGDLDGDGAITYVDLDELLDEPIIYCDWDNDGNKTATDAELCALAAGILPGDVNLDGNVDAADLNIIGIYWGQPRFLWWQGDVTRDGWVDAADLNLLGKYWGM